MVGSPLDGSTAFDECLSIRDGHLWIEACDTVELAQRFGTPIHVISEDHLRRNVRRTVAAFRNAPGIDADRFRTDLDRVASQDTAPRG